MLTIKSSSYIQFNRTFFLLKIQGNKNEYLHFILNT